MTKPDDIPQDVWDVVINLDLYPVADGDRAYLPADDLFTIARAIMAATAAERGTCIGVVLSFERSHGKPGAVASNPFADVRKIAAAIRSRP